MMTTEGRLLYPDDFVEPLVQELAQARASWAEAVEVLPEGHECRALLEVCFLGSLLEEEGRPVTFTLGFSASASTYPGAETLIFAKALPLSPEAIRRLAPALNPERTHIAAQRTPVGLTIWGLIHFGRPAIPTGERYAPPYLTFNVRRPAEFEVRLLSNTILRYSRGSGAVRSPGAQHEGGQLVRLLGEMLPIVDDELARHHAALYVNDIARDIQRFGKGGTVLVVAAGARPIGLDLHEHFTPTAAHSELLTRQFEASLELSRSPPQRAREPNLGARFQLQRRREAIEFVASLAGVDGALVLDTRLRIIGFGARIRLTRPSEHLPAVYTLNPWSLSAQEAMPPPTFLGMRHRSAIQFCQMQEEPVLALVVSQDAGLSLITKGQREEGKVLAAIPLGEDVV